jgi:hypothetical protein
MCQPQVNQLNNIKMNRLNKIIIHSSLCHEYQQNVWILYIINNIINHSVSVGVYGGDTNNPTQENVGQ